MAKLEKLLSFISEHNSYYKNIINQYKIIKQTDITKYPILTRQQLQKNRYNMFSDGYMTKYYSEQLIRQSSSGSSGVPVNVYWEDIHWYASNIPLWRRRRQWYGIRPDDKCVMFTLNAINVADHHRQSYYVNTLNNRMNINVSSIRNNDDYKQIIDIISEYDPKWLYVQPSVLANLVKSYKESNKRTPPSLKYIESVGEYLQTKLRNEASELFNVAISVMYGSEEMNGIAYECPNNHLHVLEDNVYVEVYCKDAINKYGEGEAIVTNLNNWGMPLIRYNQADRIILSQCKDDCSYDSKSSVIEKIIGRSFDNVVLNDGTELSPYSLFEIVSEVNNQFADAINAYKFEYNRSSNILYCLIEVDEESDKWLDSIRSEINKAFNMKYLEKINLTFLIGKLNSYENGKHQMFEIRN